MYARLFSSLFLGQGPRVHTAFERMLRNTMEKKVRKANGTRNTKETDGREGGDEGSDEAGLRSDLSWVSRDATGHELAVSINSHLIHVMRKKRLYNMSEAYLSCFSVYSCHLFNAQEHYQLIMKIIHLQHRQKANNDQDR
jgi:hypothetical protein